MSNVIAEVEKLIKFQDINYKLNCTHTSIALFQLIMYPERANDSMLTT